jgi:NAD(P)-dependent dehydrogenase (short-subunit alcohol dehydrogenase family)
MNLKLENKLAFISGSTAGIGFATPDEVAAMVAFVASPLSSATNGAALRAEGGVLRSIL